MISESTINKLVEPIITRQENINIYVLNKIATKIKEIGTLSSSDVYTLTRLRQVGDDIREINKELARLTGLQEKEIKKLIKKFGTINLNV